MKLVVAVVGRLKDRYLEDGIQEYSKRIKRYSALNLVRIREEKKSGHQLDAAVAKEGEKILQLKRPGDTLLALTEEGQLWDSSQWAERMDHLILNTPGRIIFAIGSGPGHSPEVKQQADQLLSLSPLTFPHQLALLLLLEQIYRGFTILRNEPYHK